MIRRASYFLVPFALCAIGLFALFLTGCERRPSEGQTTGVISNSPPVMTRVMNDPAFRAGLAETRRARNELVATRNGLVDRMTAMIEAKKRELKTEDLERVRAALVVDPEWQSLTKRCEDVNQAIRENLASAREQTHARVSREVKGQISK